MLSYSRPVERCRPLLGTFVRIRVTGLAPERAQVAISAAFAEIVAVHQLMSFRDCDCDVARLNREARLGPVEVNARTFAVLQHAEAISQLSGGTFDITIASSLVGNGMLPRPSGACEPDPFATWGDIMLMPRRLVRFQRPLWIDLGGIAKGYAVDRAIETLEAFSPVQASVNAGGDLRVIGTENVVLADDQLEPGTVPIVNLHDGSLASSSGRVGPRSSNMPAEHIDPLDGPGHTWPRFVSVIASRCMDADALTKIVMAREGCARSCLVALDARALVYDAQSGWRQVPGAP